MHDIAATERARSLLSAPSRRSAVAPFLAMDVLSQAQVREAAGFILAFLAMFDVGQRIAISAPGYPAYRNILEALGLVAVVIGTGAATRHVVTGPMIAAEHAVQKLDGVLLMSPVNPTGTMMTPQALGEVARTCASLGIKFISNKE